MKELRDQSAHFIAAVLALLPLAIMPMGAGFLWAGFFLGLVREVTEEGTPVTFAKVREAIVTSPLDLTFWTLGGAAMGVLYGYIR